MSEPSEKDNSWIGWFLMGILIGFLLCVIILLIQDNPSENVPDCEQLCQDRGFRYYADSRGISTLCDCSHDMINYTSFNTNFKEVKGVSQ